MKKSLLILLSYFCNFKCSHCINSSSPESSNVPLTNEEVEEICKFINTNSFIERVGFSGGEPTLHLSTIQEIQTKINRDVLYSLTTNGWFGKNPDTVLGKINLHALVVSYDKYHQPFVNLATIRNLLEAAVAKEIKTTLNFVYEDLSELTRAKELLIPGVQLKPVPVIKGGRQINNRSGIYFHNDKMMDESCPSLNLPNGTDKIIYIPGKGFTPCCGPLSFDAMTSDDFIYTDFKKHYEENPLFCSLKKGSFRQQYEKCGLVYKHMNFSDSCAICTFLYADHKYAGLPSKYFLCNQKEYPAYFPIKSKLSKEDVTAITQDFDVVYIYSGKVGRAPTNTVIEPKTVGIEIKKWHKHALEDFLSLIKKTLLDQAKEFYPNGKFNKFYNMTKQYLPEAQFKEFYYFEKKIVGALITKIDPHHFLLKKPAFQIGFCGYDSDVLSSHQIQMFRDLLLAKILQWNKNDYEVATSVYYYNTRSQKANESIGLLPTFMRLERKYE